MNFGFSEEQESLRETAARVLAAESPPAVVRAAIDDPDAWRSVWKTIVELGWTGIAVPEAHGGLGLGVVDLVALVEVTGRWVLPAPLTSSTGLAAPMLAAAEGPGPAEALGEIVAGHVAALAADGVADHPTASVSWDGRRLTGTCRLVPDAARADLLAVPAASDDGPVVVAVPTSADGVRVDQLESVDPTRPIADVSFDVPLDASSVAPCDVDSRLDIARIVLAAELVGVCDRMLEVTVEHVRSRRQFDRPIGAFQAVKHRLADAYVLTERARTLTYNAAMLQDDGEATREARADAAALAKAAASEAGIVVAKSGVQLHGAIAMTWEHDVHLFTRRARHAALCLGDHRYHYRRAAEGYLSGVR